MWEITLLCKTHDIDEISSLEKELKNAYSSEIFMSCLSHDDDYIVSIAVNSSNDSVVSFCRLEIAKTIVRIVKQEYYITRLQEYMSSYHNIRFIVSILVSIGSEMEVLKIIYRLTMSKICIRSFVMFCLKDMVSTWHSVIDGIMSEFQHEKEEVIVIEFLKYIVTFMHDDNVELYVEAVNNQYLLYTMDRCQACVVDKDDEADLIIGIINVRPRCVTIKNQHMFSKPTYNLLKYVFDAKIRVEV